MDYNTIIIIAGSIIILIALLIVMRSNNQEPDNHYNSSIIHLQNIKDQELELQQVVIHELEGLKGDMGIIKEDISTLFSLYNDLNRNSLSKGASNNDTGQKEVEPFNQKLNYNIFTQKNTDIIRLHQEGNSPDEIARKLNKSIREIEMVIKLVK
ncbi:hypothetical protein F8154_04880 [Alkaliphilus pronyensis]|uniref:Uncharacterized protein n=1 Tax=Alkaliphilus pronyensis TaxID=1482732 RepID=A0A6I0FAQ3_9FIRM|nr:hypothetical protein [Alkaliphilus pronyensis]KAB3535853.1 hypothetical protein F8154_04880 [Alkaliphilus pronyensis]